MPDFVPNFTRILSIDGGGLRGMIPARVLVALERKLQAATGDPETRLADHFDLIAGTSTGGILACIYLCPPSSGARGRTRFSAADVVGLYRDRGAEIFAVPLAHRVGSVWGLRDEKYPAAGLEHVLEDYAGDVWLSDLLKPCLIPAYDIQRRQAHFFTQHDAVRQPGYDFPLRQVARATSAAPTYFEVAQVTSRSGVQYPLVDGGVFAGNPAMCAYAEARVKLPGNPRAAGMVLVSLGTGAALRPYQYHEARDWGLVGWARPIFDMMLSGVAETVDYQLRQMFDAVGTPDQYIRLQAGLDHWPADVLEMDNAHPKNLADLEQIGAELAEAQDRDLDRVVKLLLTPAA